MAFVKSKLGSNKKKLLGALVIIAFVAFGSILATRYLAQLDIDLGVLTLAIITIISLALLYMEMRTKIKKSRRR